MAVAENGTVFRRNELTDGVLWVAGHWTGLGLCDVQVALETDAGLVPLPNFTAGLPPLVGVNLLAEADGPWRGSRYDSPTYYSPCYPARWLKGWRTLAGLYGSYAGELWAIMSRARAHEDVVSSVYRRVDGKWSLQRRYSRFGDQVCQGTPWNGGLLAVIEGYGLRPRLDLIHAAGPVPRLDALPFSDIRLFKNQAGALLALVCKDDCQLAVWAPGAVVPRTVALPTLMRGRDSPRVRYLDDDRVQVTGSTWSDRGWVLYEGGAKQTRIVVSLKGEPAIVEQEELRAVPPALPPDFYPSWIEIAANGARYVSGRPYVDGVMKAVVVSDRAVTQVWRPELHYSLLDLPVDWRCQNAREPPY